ncbi:MAG: L-aspartate oxidase, partial [Myxococcota bacterium]
MRHDTDILVLGSGSAGLSYALKAAEHGRVTVLTKRATADSATSWAQGGISAVVDREDSFEIHAQDTISAGAGLCHPKAVELCVTKGPDRIRELIELGVGFSKAEGGGFDLGKEGGHTRRRVLHARDMTGKEIERALVEAVCRHPRITVIENQVAIDLITSGRLGIAGPNRCLGAYVIDRLTHDVRTWIARLTVLATGGAGKVYLYTSNPDVATGDGVAMAFRAGAPVSNMEFFQFHPTCLYHSKAKSFLISEALRGEGGVLRLLDGSGFMERYHEMASLAPRDVVARAIDAEMKRTGDDHVVLDMSA